MPHKARPLVLAAATYTLLGGYVHLNEWLNGYRNIPASVPGSWVVRIGFPLNTAASVLLAAVLILAALRLPKLVVPTLAANVGFQLSSLGILIATRVGSVFGWAEPSWTPGANRARAVEIGAVLLSALAVVGYRRGVQLVRGRDHQMPLVRGEAAIAGFGPGRSSLSEVSGQSGVARRGRGR